MIGFAIGIVCGLLLQIAFPMIGFEIRDFLIRAWDRIKSKKQ